MTSVKPCDSGAWVMASQEDGAQSLIPVAVVMHLLRAVQHGQTK